ncbi:hypothetical protein F2P56_010746 [Juglans regia]|uniref:Uncharacterized protein LOC108980822 n=2 Tax=Juglans regia TaxID=51240 RepID=A0A6P9EU96_JUGRE|nr:uncharacterized protein LOC108980822 [Juglans regia]KAF5470221.1 hypothetical protein F2P56_010746 [Juglans regia]
MSEFCFSSTFKKTGFSSLLLFDLIQFCFFILSHPLYFCYFIFFSPYLLKLLSFLSPLLITTFLLLLVLLTVSPKLVQEYSHSESSESKVASLVSTSRTLFERLQPKVDDGNEDFQQFEELEVFKIVFDKSTFEIGEAPVEVLEWEVKEVCSEAYEAPVDKSVGSGGNCISGLEALTGNSDAYQVPTTRPGITQQNVEVKRLECFFQEENGLETMFCVKEEKEINQPGIEFYEVEEGKEESSMRNGSKAMYDKTNDSTTLSTNYSEEHDPQVMVNSQRLGASMGSPRNVGEDSSKFMENSKELGSKLGSFGSMRKEKEWRRTLACKLFEERHNVNGGEGMDMLWETYETESKKVQGRINKKKKSGKSVEYEEDEVEEDDIDGQLCCLQALKFSAGKMNLGMGRPNLVKFSKALKGIGWLHHFGRHGKKGYH